MYRGGALRGWGDLVQRVCNALGESGGMQVSEGSDCCCEFARDAPTHHARLVLLEREPLAVIGELIDIAATWGEVEHGADEPVIEPSDWLTFVDKHDWQEPERLHEMVLSLWSVTLPCSHDVARTANLDSKVARGSVTKIETARTRRRAEQTA